MFVLSFFLQSATLLGAQEMLMKLVNALLLLG